MGSLLFFIQVFILYVLPQQSNPLITLLLKLVIAYWKPDYRAILVLHIDRFAHVYLNVVLHGVILYNIEA